ncbi:chemosensory receptor a [Plakobranchus ocellatus]|uniref:Chemosensory receptor a n=1 Tax=Plakobranchus ocellatus TaxID=259542 RepID=A0AAV3Y7V1_9GAST|nr:chemosensory receptor a [Plakobranchus ocellatus]
MVDLLTPTLNCSRTDITSQATLWMTSVVLRVYIPPVLSAFSLGSNIVNILVFSRMGLKDGATATFLVLSISDGATGCFNILYSILTTIRYLGPIHLRRTAYTIFMLIMVPPYIFHMTSTLCTVVIAIVRCCSVAMPFRVKSVFTVRRQLLTIMILAASTTVITCYGISCYRVIQVLDPQTNITHLVLTLTPDFARQIQVFDMYRFVVIYSSFIIVNICLVILIVALKRSSNFRTKAAGTVETDKKPTFNVQESCATIKFKLKEKQVVRTVVLVSLVFTICNLPYVVLLILRQTLPEFKIVGCLSRSFDMLAISSEAATSVNVCVNIFIYYYSHANYRNVFKRLVFRK